MDIRRLEIFCKLMETRSFSRTAEEISIRQPTVSGHIKTLEEEIGARLFDRDGREVLPTSTAEVLYDYAQRILNLRTEARYAIDQFMGRIGGHLKLGGSTIPGGYILPIVMGNFHEQYKEAHLSLTLDDTSGIVDRVLNGEIEIGVVGAKLPNENLEYRFLVKDEMVLIIPPNHPWSVSGVIPEVRDLTKTHFIMREQGSGTRATMLNALKRHGIGIEDLHVVAEMGSTEAVRQAVKAGLGVSILSRTAVTDEIVFNRLKAIEVQGLNLKRQFYIVLHKKRTRSPLCQVFLEHMEKHTRKLLEIYRGKHD
ncbi:MAG: LysR family transcriptional regulator [Deltaproteobacteria bacterium]|nr:LysR family transcriptional regulator [Deltaproteobacteria bacterium]